MSLLFSQIQLTAVDGSHTEFLAGGIPREASNLEGWHAYEDFMEEFDSEVSIHAHVEAFIYGEGETNDASPEEVAYLYQRVARDSYFLSDHTDNIEDVDFNFNWLPYELLGEDIIEI